MLRWHICICTCSVGLPRGVFLLILPQIGAVFSRQVPPTRTEKEMRRRLAEMKETEESP